MHQETIKCAKIKKSYNFATKILKFNKKNYNSDVKNVTFYLLKSFQNTEKAFKMENLAQ